MMIGLLAQGVPGLILLAAGLAKSVNLKRFAGTVVQFKVVPKRAALQVARAVVMAEVVLGAALSIGFTPMLIVISAEVLFACLTIAILIALAKGNSGQKCGCGGDGFSQTIGWHSVARNGCLMLLIGLPLVWQSWTEPARWIIASSLFALFALTIKRDVQRPAAASTTVNTSGDAVLTS